MAPTREKFMIYKTFRLVDHHDHEEKTLRVVKREFPENELREERKSIRIFTGKFP